MSDSGYVKVMRSYDYCHFEVCLPLAEGADLDAVNQRRKEAAILADEAVREYRIAKSKEQSRQAAEWKVEQALERLKRIKELPPSELSVEQAALLRQSADDEFWKRFHEDDYAYEQDEEREHHFSMLRKFKDTVVRV